MPNARVAVRLGPPDDVTAWIAQGAAFDAAGADALWLDLRDHPELDPYVLTAALAAVTYRCQLVLHPAEPDPGGAKEATLMAVCRGRLMVGIEDIESGNESPAADEQAADEQAAFEQAADEQAAFEQAGDEQGSDEQDGDERAGDQARRWEAAEYPADRAAWRTALTGAAERGVHGLIVPADPRLLDLLRNPDEEIDRRDLQLAAG